MKLIDKIASISFWINIIYLVSILIGIPILFMNSRNFMDYATYKNGLNPINITLSILNSVAAFHWGYCIWFLFKYDRYSKSILPLLFFSVWYAPIYYYRVIIKKRPLRNKINKPVEPIAEDYSISDAEFIELTRENIIGVLNLWASETELPVTQETTPGTQMSLELFEQWFNNYIAGSEVITEAFNPGEIDFLSNFDSEIKATRKKLHGKIPQIEEFVEMPECKNLNQLANEILKNFDKQNTVGNTLQ